MEIQKLEFYLQVMEYSAKAHGDQKRKYTEDPYIIHPMAVSEIVGENLGDEAMVYAALLHDVLEDTPVTSTQLLVDLHDMGMLPGMAFDVHDLVVELTDVYTKENFPSLNRKARKDLEAQRLGRASSRAQSIKYADLLDNTKSITEHDPGFAKVYLQEKAAILSCMTSGDHHLFMRCLRSLNQNV
jgi:(p)ppGpp synthase/HD superfamily hydrolase